MRVSSFVIVFLLSQKGFAAKLKDTYLKENGKLVLEFTGILKRLDGWFTKNKEMSHKGKVHVKFIEPHSSIESGKVKVNTNLKVVYDSSEDFVDFGEEEIDCSDVKIEMKAAIRDKPCIDINILDHRCNIHRSVCLDIPEGAECVVGSSIDSILSSFIVPRIEKEISKFFSNDILGDFADVNKLKSNQKLMEDARKSLGKMCAKEARIDYEKFVSELYRRLEGVNILEKDGGTISIELDVIGILGENSDSVFKKQFVECISDPTDGICRFGPQFCEHKSINLILTLIMEEQEGDDWITPANLKQIRNFANCSREQVSSFLQPFCDLRFDEKGSVALRNARNPLHCRI